MKLANVDGRAALVLGDAIADIGTVSAGRFSPDLMAIYGDWRAFAEFAATVSTTTGPRAEPDLRNPIPAPRQVFVSASTTALTRRNRGQPCPTCP